MPDDVVLDLGCGNGYSTWIFAERVKEIIGGDFSPEMIKRAFQENIVASNIQYQLMDARDFHLDRMFTKVITERCLINILDWSQQQQAIETIGRGKRI